MTKCSPGRIMHRSTSTPRRKTAFRASGSRTTSNALPFHSKLACRCETCRSHGTAQAPPSRPSTIVSPSGQRPPPALLGFSSLCNQVGHGREVALSPTAVHSPHGLGNRPSILALDTAQATLNKGFFQCGQLMKTNSRGRKQTSVSPIAKHDIVIILCRLGSHSGNQDVSIARSTITTAGRLFV